MRFLTRLIHLGFLNIFDEKLHDMNVMDCLPPEASTFYIIDRVYLDFQRLCCIHFGGGFTVLGPKSIKIYRLK